MKEVDRILEDYQIPSLPEWTKECTYLQTTIRHKIIEQRKRKDIVFIPVV